MKTLALKDGDLVLTGDRYAMVEGMARLQQTVTLALRERYGIDRFHPGWGSTLHRMVGRPYEAGSRRDIENEIVRVLNNIVQAQIAFVRTRTNEGRTPPISAGEMISGITDIQIAQDFDQVSAKVTLQTMGREEFSVLTTQESV